MSSKLQRRIKKAAQKLPSRYKKQAQLSLEPLEQRLLLDVAGYWDELGWRSASGGGISWDNDDRSGGNGFEEGEAQLVISSDGDPVALWIEGTFNEYVDTPIPYHFEMSGSILARQYADDIGWWDLSQGSGDGNPSGVVESTASSQLSVAAGPNGQIVAAWVTGVGAGSEIYIKSWDGQSWEEVGGSATGGGISDDGVINEKPSVAVSDLGEIYVSYTAVHPVTSQREIVVKRFGYAYDSDSKLVGPPQNSDLSWTELSNEEVGLFGERSISGVSADVANSFDSAIILDNESRPIVVWSNEFGQGNIEIYLKRWDGDSWLEMGVASASDANANGLSGVSSDVGMSLQPDLAITDDGQVVVTWVNWADWQNYDQAGIYVKKLESGVWTEYEAGISASGAGIAPSLGGYFSPSIDLTSDGRPFVVWGGYGEDERFAVDRDDDSTTPGIPESASNESPLWGIYGSVFETGSGFDLLASASDPNNERANPYVLIDGQLQQYHCWMPTALVGTSDELVMAYSWRDTLTDEYHICNEVFAQQWDSNANDWVTFGRGSNTIGNDVFGTSDNSAGYFSEDHTTEETVEAEVQLGLIDYDNNPATDYDVMEANGEHVYVYNRQTDTWSIIDPVGGYGEVFDLKGDPAVEYNVDGAPLLAYVDTDPFSATYRSVFVLQWSGGDWIMLGGDAAGAVDANAPLDSRPTGISVQAGPNGTALVVYVSYDGSSNKVMSRIWDGATWSDAGGGSVDKGSILEALYYSNFDGYDFSEASLTTVEFTDGLRVPDYEDYVTGEWYFDPLETNPGWLDGNEPWEVELVGEIHDEIGPLYVAPNDQVSPAVEEETDSGLLMTLAVPENDPVGYDSDSVIIGQFDHQFRMINDGYVVIEMMYAIDAFNMDTDIFLLFDGNEIDVDITDDIPLTPIDSVGAGFIKSWDDGGFTTVTFDSKALGLEKLTEGEHRVSLRAVAQVSCPNLGPDVWTAGDDAAEAAAESNPYDDKDTGSRFFKFTTGAADNLDGWTYVDDGPVPNDADGAWDADAGSGGVGDGGLQLTLSDASSTSWTTTISGSFTRDFELSSGGDVELSLGYSMLVTGGNALAVGDTLDLQVFLDGPDGIINLSEFGDYQATGGDADVAYTTITVPVDAMETLPQGDYTLIVRGILTDNAGAGDSSPMLLLDDFVVTTTDEVLSSDFDHNPDMSGWYYADVNDPGDTHADGAWNLDANLGPGGGGTGGLEMIITGAGAQDPDLEGGFNYDFNFGGPVTITFDYNLIAGAAMDVDSTVTLVVAIDGKEITSREDSADLDWIYATADGAGDISVPGTFSIELAGLANAIEALNELASGGHTITISAVMSDSAAGTGTLQIDNFQLYGSRQDEVLTFAWQAGSTINDDNPSISAGSDLPHRSHFRVDNFAVYQRVVPQSESPTVIDTSPFEFDADMEGWVYQALNDDPSVDITGVWDADAGDEGAADGGLKMTLGDGTNAVTDLMGAFSYEFTLDAASAGFLDLEFSYSIETGSSINSWEGVGFYMYITEVGNPGFTPIDVHFDSVIASGGASRTSGWQTISMPELGISNALTGQLDPLPEGTYSLVASVLLTNSGDAAVPPADNADNQAVFMLDDVSLKSYNGIGDWELAEAGGDTGPDTGFFQLASRNMATNISSFGAPDRAELWGGNFAVGSDPNENDDIPQGVYDFDGCIHSTLAATGTQLYVIDDITQAETGDLVIGFRYRLDAGSFDMSVLIDGVAYGFDGVAGTMLEADTGGWWNYDSKYDSNIPYYVSVEIVVPGIERGDHTVSIALTDTTDLWIDNLYVLGTQKTNSIKPKAILLPTSDPGSQRHFGVAATNQAPEARVYENTNDIYPDGMILSMAKMGDGIPDGYQSAAVFELVSSSDTWRMYGDLIESNIGIDFTGLGTSTSMPMADIYYLEDLVVGSDGTFWVAMQHATVDWVDISNPADGINDVAIIHPWVVDDPPAYWHAPTELDIDIFRWNPFAAIPSGSSELWEDTGFVPSGEDAAAVRFTDVEIVSSGGQLPTVAWTDRGDHGAILDSRAQRYEINDTWGVLNTESVQNDDFWSALWLRDMIVREDGFPIVSYYMWHNGSDGIREFRRADNIAAITVTEASGTINDNLLEYGTTSGAVVDRSFTVTSNGPGDLVIYGIDLGGQGDQTNNPFTLRNPPTFPLTIESDGAFTSWSFTVRFNPNIVDEGIYSSVALVHTDTTTHPDHPYGKFYELSLLAEVVNNAEIDVDPEWLSFEDTVIGETSSIREVVISNLGEDDLTIDQWFFDDNNYEIFDAFVTSSAPGGGIVVTDLGTNTNVYGAADDVVLAPGSFLTLQLVFEPDDTNIFNDTLYIRSDDFDEPFTAVSLTGVGISGAQISVLESSGVANNDDIIDFESVVMGTDSSPIWFTIVNNGFTDLTITDIYEETGDPAIFIDQQINPNDPVVLAPGGTLPVSVIFSPPPLAPGALVDVEELLTRIFIESDDATLPSYEVTVLGLAVPEVPIINIRENSGVSPNDKKLEFGTINVGQVVVQTFTIENIGGDDLTLKSFLITQFDTPYLVVPENNAGSADDIVLTLAGTATDSQVVTVTFMPTETGSFQHTLNIRSDNRDQPNDITQIILQGTAVNPLISVTDDENSTPDSIIDFGNIAVDATSQQQTVTIENQGSSDLVITGWSVDNNVFVALPTFNNNVTVTAGNTFELVVTFTPDNLGDFTGQIQIDSNDMTNPNWIVDLSGAGVTVGQVSLTDTETSTPNGQINFSTALGKPLIAGQDSAIQQFTITNLGQSNLVIKGILITPELDLGNLPDPLSSSRLVTSPFGLDINGSSYLDPENAGDDLILGPGGSLTDSQSVLVTFAPFNPFNGTVWATIVTEGSSGNDVVNYVELTGESIFAMQVGDVGGIRNPKQVFYDDNGSLVQITVSGGGYANVVLDNGYYSGADIEKIELVNTTARTTVRIISAQQTTIGQISGNIVRNISLTNVMLDGDGVVGDSLEIGNLTGMVSLTGLINGADIDIDATGGRGIKLMLGDVGDGSDVDVAGDIALLKTTLFGNGTIHSQGMNKLIAGPGDFDATVEVDEDLNVAILSTWHANGNFFIGNDLNKLTANSATFTGQINADNIGVASFNQLLGSQIGVRENLRSLTVRTRMTDSRVMGGYDLLTEQLFAGSQVKKVSVRGKFNNSYVTAGIAPFSDDLFFGPSNQTKTGSVGAVSFGDVDWDNDDTNFGVFAHTDIDRVVAGSVLYNPGENRQDFWVNII
ncbi:MAG: choice-of-anchor D domain-containing protein [Sedimentisphaerales bacterium]|nr:choice-of-anchor D domain-containing protein [Sedimentisphaerales bacterium]